MLRFTLFRIPVQVQPGFWLLAGIFGFRFLRDANPAFFLIWVAVVFLSILAHEFGHAFAIMRHGLSPSVALYMMGGVTVWQRPHEVSRAGRVFISFAGPLAGFVLAGIAFGIELAFAEQMLRIQPLGFAVAMLIWVNTVWGLFNLIPVLPFDGGHILEEVLGPKRRRTTAVVSAGCGFLIAAVMLLYFNSIYGALLVGVGAFQSYQRLRAEPEPARQAVQRQQPSKDDIPGPMQGQLAAARHALDEDQLDQAGTIAELVLASNPPPAARLQALHVLGWAYLMGEKSEDASRVIQAIEREGDADLALVAGVLLAKGEQGAARELLESARASGDNRKEIVGPLIQVLIAGGDVGRAAAIAYDIVDSLSEEDARQMATIAYQADHFEWASRLLESTFERSEEPDDAYNAARNRALEGDPASALALLERAVQAGFSDAALAWSDAALERLRLECADELESVLPKPS